MTGKPKLTPKKEVKWTPPEGYTVFEGGDDYCVLERTGEDDEKEFVVYSEQFGIFKPVSSLEDTRNVVDLVRRLLAKGLEDD